MISSTERLIIRELAESDFNAFHEMQSDEEVMRYTTGKAFDADENWEQLRDCIARYAKPNNDFWVWAVARKADLEFVGTCAIVPHEGSSEIGYRLLQKCFGHGYGQEICDGLIEHGISGLRLEGMVAFVDARNTASIKILDRSRMKFIRDQFDADGNPERYYRWTSEDDGLRRDTM